MRLLFWVHQWTGNQAKLKRHETEKEEKSKLHYVKPDNSLSSLVDVLNKIGVNTKDLISILQAMEEAGALVASIEVI